MNPRSVLVLSALAAAITLAACERRTTTVETPASSTTTTTTMTPAPTTGSMSSAASDAMRSTGSAMATAASATGTALERAGDAIGDAAVTAKVKTALLADPDVKGLQIDVDTKDGVVTLTGAIDRSNNVEKAATLARGIDGVKSVSNNLTVRP